MRSPCLLAHALGETVPCDSRCVFFIDGSCLPERLMPTEQWDAKFARRWLAARAGLEAAPRHPRERR